MTVINGIEIDDINYKQNDIKYAISNNDPIENKLNVIIVISNPCLYAKRYILLKEFVKRFEEEESNVELFIVEMIYNKENMVNLGVKNLLPLNWKAFAWIDADIEFESNSWALDTLKILNGCKDIVQIFSHAIDMDKDETSLNHFNSFGYSFCKNKKYTIKGLDYWHPGFAWAITRKAYEKIGGLYDVGVLGSGDNIMAIALINKCEKLMNINYSEDYNNSMLEFQKKAKSLRLGYTPGVIRHHYHGSKKNRQYTERWQILIKYLYSPTQHLKYNETGILIPTELFTKDFKNDIMTYFKERKEDD